MSTATPRAGGAAVSAQRRRHRRPEHWLLAQLPPWMRDDDFFARFVSMFEAMATTHLDHVDQLEHVFDLTVAPPEMVRALGRCVGVDLLDPQLDETLQREVLIEMGLLARRQGTRRRLTRVLELVTRQPVEVIDSGAVVIDGGAPPAPPHVRIRVESTGWMDEDDLVALVRRELPASVTFELWLGDRPLWPAPEPAPIDASPTACPGCGTPTEHVALLMDADEFCTTCDFPLFWAPGAQRLPPMAAITPIDPDPELSSSRVDQATTVACPSCDQITELDASALRTADGFCAACDFPLWWAPGAYRTI